MKYLYLFFPLSCLLPSYLLGQGAENQQTHQFLINKTSEKIEIDGLLDENVWDQIQPVGKFWYSFPIDDRAVENDYQTEVKVTYDDKFLYISAVCYGPGPFIIPSLKRDNRQFWSGDVFSIAIDAVNERTNGYSFGTNPAGVQFDTQIGANTGTRGNSSGSGFNVAWDNKWYTNSTSYEDKWVTEMAIPFNSLKFGEKTNWGINFIRGVSKTNSWHTWAPVPVQFTGVDLGYTGLMNWDEKPPQAKSNISLIPYALTGVDLDYEEGTDRNVKGEIGGDAKVALGSNLTLDLTLNPDFSQVDVDEQVTNLSTVNIRFPERRLFFLENTDIFSEFGIPPMRPFFSRRIGLDEDNNPIPINFGGRLSGNVTKDLRIGLMNLQTGQEGDFYGQNYSSFAFNQRIIGRTVLKGFFHNRQAYVDSEFSTTDYNRALGGEIDFRSSNGQLRANAGYGASLSDGISTENKTVHGIISYDSRTLSFYANVMTIGNDYIPDMGFMSWLNHYDAENDTTYRIGYMHTFTRGSYTWYPENPKVNNHAISFRSATDMATDRREFFIANLNIGYDINFSNSSSLGLEVVQNSNQLFFPFDFTDGEPLPVGKYSWRTAGIKYQSDRRKTFFYTVGIEGGGFYSGERAGFSLQLNYRHQPWGNFALNFVRNELNFSEPYGSKSLTLLGPKIEINMSRNLFWTTFFQYNTQSDNFNINSRFQWQFKPLSNLFIVYTDNYAIEMFGPKNRGVVIKLNHWINL